MTIGDDTSEPPLKPRRAKSREVSSRFLSPTGTPLHDSAIPSPNQAHSPVRRKPAADARKNRSLEDSGTIRGGLWPSTATGTTTSSSSSQLDMKLDTLATHLGNDRLKDLVERRKDEKSGNSISNSDALFLARQRSCTVFSRFENDKNSCKENHRPSFGGSMRHTGKFLIAGKSSSNSSSSSSPSSSSSAIAPGRFSVDESALYRKSAARRHSDILGDNMDSDTDYGASKDSSFSSYLASTVSSRKSGKEVVSKYLQDAQTRSRKGSSDLHPVSLDSSPKKNKFSIKNAMKRANSLTGYGSATSQWALSPGRSGSPPISVEHKEKLMSFSSLKPPSSPSRSAKGVDKLLHMGLDLFKSKKSSLSSLGSLDLDAIHQLKLLHNNSMQWRYANARADAVNENIAKETQINLVYACYGLKKLQHSVLQKRVLLQKEKLKMKLNFILHSQIKLLETWGDMERQHLSAVCKTKEGLHSVVCRVPLAEGAKLSAQSTAIALRHASDLATSIQSTLTFFSPMAEEAISSISELAEVVAQEKLLLEECLELLRTISTLEIQERSLKCSLIQLKSWQQQQQQQPEGISSY